MSDSADSTAAAPRESVPAPASSPSAGRRRAPRWPWLLLAIGLVAAAGWALWNVSRAPDAGVPLVADDTTAAPAAGIDIATLQRSLDDAARVNRALREQVLGLTQRVGLVEDGLAGMERGAAPGIDAVRLAEADFLLRLGEERLRLFADVSGARAAFALADGQLSEVSDPRATSVRQTLALERDALAGVASADLPLILAQLDRLADAVAGWPLAARDVSGSADDAAAAGWWSRLGNAVDRYFRVRRVDPGELDGAGPLLRERIALDLSRARLLLLRAEGAAALAAIESVRTQLLRRFDAADPQVAAALGVLDEVRRAPLVPQWPQLGESRRELARLRGVPTPPAPAAAIDVPAADADDGAEGAEESSPDAVIAAPDQPTVEAGIDVDRADDAQDLPGDDDSVDRQQSAADGG